MPRTVYYSKRYNQRTGVDSVEAASAVVFSKVPRRSLGRVVPLIMIACLLLAVASVLVVPMLLSGSAAASTAHTSVPVLARAAGSAEAVTYESVTEAAATLSIESAVPGELPEGFLVSGVTVLGDRVLELGLTGKADVLLRCAAGSEDLSGIDYDALAYTSYETSGNTTCFYAGVSDKKFVSAVWVSGDYTYALVSENGIEAESMRQLTEFLA